MRNRYSNLPTRIPCELANEDPKRATDSLRAEKSECHMVMGQYRCPTGCCGNQRETARKTEHMLEMVHRTLIKMTKPYVYPVQQYDDPLYPSCER